MAKTVVIVHGLGSSRSQVEHMGSVFVRAGYDVHYVEYNSNLVGDKREVQKQLDQIPNPDAVIGHSQGGRVINELARDGYNFGNASLFAVNSPFVSNKSGRVEFLQTSNDGFRDVDPFSASADFGGGHSATAEQMNYIFNRIYSGQSNSLATRTDNLNRNSSTFSSFK